ncbi:MAG: oxaloacetate decarboxylase, alpha subunit [Chloroflexi bacterium]|jgi:oxaloacetate decarboxylase alpha subunit|nr:MAG: oxaloacetate decarboxylase, alpha subunit [Chloroflexota bacterium]
MPDIRFSDTTIRDGPNSLWAQNGRTGMLTPVVENLDNAGFESIEIDGNPSKKIVRELKENPWERIREIAKRATRTPLRVVGGRSFVSFDLSPLAMYQMKLETLARNGVHQLRLSDSGNEVEGWAERLTLAKAAGLDVIINLIYSISPRHTDEYYALKTQQAVALKPLRICLKDPSGLLTPDRMRTIVPAIQEHLGGHTLELHTHCTTGLGPLTALEGIKLGIPNINVAVPPLANGSGNPSVFHIAQNARALGYTPLVDEEILKPVETHFNKVVRREGFTVGEPLEYDEGQYQHQVPGGMISNLRFQLGKLNRSNLLNAVLEECKQVRAEMGYPVMVTPFSQFVGSQAAINVISGTRYEVVTEQVIQYALGWWGYESANAMNQDVRDKILNRKRAQEVAADPVPQPTIEEIRRQFGNKPDEEILLRFAAGDEAVDELQRVGPHKPYHTGPHAVVSLVERLLSPEGPDHLAIHRPGFDLVAGRRRND